MLLMMFSPVISYHKCDIVLAKEKEARAIYFLHENIKNQLTIYNKKLTGN